MAREEIDIDRLLQKRKAYNERAFRKLQDAKNSYKGFNVIIESL